MPEQTPFVYVRNTDCAKEFVFKDKFFRNLLPFEYQRKKIHGRIILNISYVRIKVSLYLFLFPNFRMKNIRNTHECKK